MTSTARLRLPLTDWCVSTQLASAGASTLITFNIVQLVEFGKEILKIIPGRVSTEVDARLSFDKEGTKKKVCSSLLLLSLDMRADAAVASVRPRSSLPSTNPLALTRSVSSSKSLRHGKASRPPVNLSNRMAYTAT